MWTYLANFSTKRSSLFPGCEGECGKMLWYYQDLPRLVRTINSWVRNLKGKLFK